MYLLYQMYCVWEILFLCTNADRNRIMLIFTRYNLVIQFIWLTQNLSHVPSTLLTWHALFGDLAVVDLLLQREVTHQSVDVAGLPLTVTVDAAYSLGIMARVPGGVEYHHSVRPD